MSEKLKALIIGCGDIAGGYDETGGAPGAVLSHAGAYRAHSDFELAACVDPDPERRARFMNIWGVDQGFADLQACAAAGLHVDIASLCSPSDTHDVALAALVDMPVRAVFAEKPLTGMPERSRVLVKRYADQGRPLAVNYLRRWAPGIVALKSEISSGQWGRVRGATGRYAKGLFNCGSHLIDLINFLVGPISPCDVFSTVTDFSDADPTVSARLMFENEQPAVIVGTDCRDFFIFELTLIMEKGEINIEDLGLSVRRRPIEKHTLFPSQSTPSAGISLTSGFDQAMVNAVSNIADHLADGTPLASDGWSALEAEETCWAIMKCALDKGHTVNPGDTL